MPSCCLVSFSRAHISLSLRCNGSRKFSQDHVIKEWTAPKKFNQWAKEKGHFIDRNNVYKPYESNNKTCVDILCKTIFINNNKTKMMRPPPSSPRCRNNLSRPWGGYGLQVLPLWTLTNTMAKPSTICRSHNTTLLVNYFLILQRIIDLCQ